MNKEQMERIAALPKQFAENFLVSAGPEAFLVACTSGASETAYVLTPQHMKRLALSLAHHVAEYEKVHGEIHADWQPGIQSPILMTDLSQGKSNGDLGKKKD